MGTSRFTWRFASCTHLGIYFLPIPKMANRRMFSNRIANSARFLQMPSESQLLYFHMVLRADDDGIVEAYPIIKLLGVPPDNLKVLISKGFIEVLNEDQVVVILNWTEHNTIRADRKTNSVYLPLLIHKFPDIEIVIPTPRSDKKDNSKRLGTVPGLSLDSLSKVKLSKVKLSKQEKLSTSKSKAQSSKLPSKETLGNIVTPSVETYSAPTEGNPKVSSNSEVEQVLEVFNKATGKSFKSTLSWGGNFKKWRKEYSLDEIKKAIENIPNHSWFSKTPEAQKPDIFFRTNKDWIADCLQVKVKPKEVYFIPQNYE